MVAKKNIYGALVAEAIKENLQRRNIAPAMIAEALETTEVSICRRLSASEPFDLNQIEKIAKILAVQLETLLFPSALSTCGTGKEG